MSAIDVCSAATRHDATRRDATRDTACSMRCATDDGILLGDQLPRPAVRPVSDSDSDPLLDLGTRIRTRPTPIRTQIRTRIRARIAGTRTLNGTRNRFRLRYNAGSWPLFGLRYGSGLGSRPDSDRDDGFVLGDQFTGRRSACARIGSAEHTHAETQRDQCSAHRPNDGRH